jgi:penicillin amidase
VELVAPVRIRLNKEGMMRKVLLVVLGVVVVVVVAAALFVGFQIRRPWPKTDGTIEVAGLRAPAEVIRDKMGVAHIYAQNSHDLFFSQGYVTAQDRFWQMEFWRRIGSGRLSEILGPSTLSQDRFIRTIGWRQSAEADLALLDADSRAALEAYADGVNAYLSQRPGRLGLEFTILGLNGVSYDPEPWSPVDTLTWAKVMSWDLGGNMDTELDRARMSALLPPELLKDYDLPYPADRPVIVPTEVRWRPEDAPALAQLSELAAGLATLGDGPWLGSNNWVVAGDRTTTGMPLLANDPHLGIQMPSIWYEIGLHCDANCPYNVVGYAFAGMPGVVIGHNATIAWGVTNTGPDVQDLYVEKINPANPDQYEYEGDWVDMDVRVETIQVAGQDEPVVIKVRSTRHGPIINDVLYGPNDTWSYGWQPLALRWTALDPCHLANSVLALDRAQNWTEFRDALRQWDVPSQNFVYADVQGNIGYQMPGRVPIRARGDGLMPAPGWTGTYEWEGTIPFDELPSRYNPAEGFIVTANNAVVDASYPYLISYEWSPGYRAQRITDLLGAQDTLSAEDMGRIQMDSYNYSASEVMPALLALQPADKPSQDALSILQGWDFQMRRDSNPAAIYAAFWVSLMDNLFADELGTRPGGSGREMLAVRTLLDDPANAWWDNQATPGTTETRDDVLLKSLADGIAWLEDNCGRLNKCVWGDLHTATFENQSLGQSGISLIERLFNRGPFPVDGGPAIVNATGWSAREPAIVSSVPSMRQVIDLSNLEASVAVHTTGQSGHAFNRHYNDMIALWQNGEYHPMHWERAAVEADAEGTLRLNPAQ